jgi:hypothetical protein
MLVPKFTRFTMDNEKLMRYNNKIYVPPKNELISLILNKDHRAVYVDHPGVKNMRAYLKPLFFWKGMKACIVKYMVRCLECQQVKVEHRHLTGLIHPHAFQNLNGRSFRWNLLLDCR